MRFSISIVLFIRLSSTIFLSLDVPLNRILHCSRWSRSVSLNLFNKDRLYPEDGGVYRSADNLRMDLLATERISMFRENRPKISLKLSENTRVWMRSHGHVRHLICASKSILPSRAVNLRGRQPDRITGVVPTKGTNNSDSRRGRKDRVRSENQRERLEQTLFYVK